MSDFARLTKLVPLAILLTLALFFQSLVMSEHGRAASIGIGDAYHTVVICADGELKNIAIDSDGNPVDRDIEIPHCASCLAGELIVLDHPAAEYEPVIRNTVSNISFNLHACPEASNVPDHPNCLDPPRLI